MPRMIEWDPVGAWRYIGVSKSYRRAWRRRRPQPGPAEPAPFPVRLQTRDDLAALRWGLLAWEDPYADGPVSPFWARVRMFEGAVSPGAPPLAALAAEGGAAVSGLRLRDGSLVVKIERDGAAVQLRIAGGEAFPADGGLVMIREVARIEDVRLGAGRAVRGRRGRDRERLLVLEGDSENLSHREIAVAIWGSERVDAEYDPDGWMHSRIKRRLTRAKTMLKRYRRLATG